MTGFEPFTCYDDGVCRKDPHGLLSEYACKRGCQSDEEARDYWLHARAVVQTTIASMVHVPSRKASSDGFNTYTTKTLAFTAKNVRNVEPIPLVMFVATLARNPRVYYFQFFRPGEEGTLRSFHVDVATPGCVILTSEQFFVATAYKAREDVVVADNYFFLADFIALGFCNDGDALELSLSDEWSTTRTVGNAPHALPVTLQSFWILLGRGYTYYENRGYVEYSLKNPFRIKEDVVHRLGTLACAGDETVADVAVRFLGAHDDASFTRVFVSVFANTHAITPQTLRLASIEFTDFCMWLEHTPEYEEYSKQKQYVKSVRLCTPETIRHLVFYTRVTLL